MMRYRRFAGPGDGVRHAVFRGDVRPPAADGNPVRPAASPVPAFRYSCCRIAAT